MILFGTRRKRQVSHAAGRAHNRRRAKIIKLNVQTTKRPLRRKSSAAVFYAFFLNEIYAGCLPNTIPSNFAIYFCR